MFRIWERNEKGFLIRELEGDYLTNSVKNVALLKGIILFQNNITSSNKLTWAYFYLVCLDFMFIIVMFCLFGYTCS